MKYCVTFKMVDYEEVEIIADSREQAKRKAQSLMNTRPEYSSIDSITVTTNP